MSSQPGAPSRIKVAAVVLFHSLTAIGVTLTSKASLNQVHSPVALLAVQTLVQTALIGSVGAAYGYVDVRSSRSAWREVAPLGVARLIGILTKTFCLEVVDASFYQIARGLLLPLTVVLSLVLLRPRPRLTPSMLASIAVVVFGFALGFVFDLQSTATDIAGLTLGIGSSLTTAIESVVVKRFVMGHKSMLQLAYMSCALQLAALAPLVLLTGEAQRLAASSEALLRFFLGATSMGLTSTLLVLATFLQIAITSPITHTVVAAARGVAQSLLAAFVFREALTGSRLASMAILTAGTLLYCLSKEWEQQRLTDKAQAEADLEDSTKEPLLEPSMGDADEEKMEMQAL